MPGKRWSCLSKGSVGILYNAVLLVAIYHYSAHAAAAAEEEDAELRSYIEASAARSGRSALEIIYPFDKSVFPPEICPPRIRWKDTSGVAQRWLLSFHFDGAGGALHFLSTEAEWRPAVTDWETIKRRSMERWTRLRIVGLAGDAVPEACSAGEVEIKSSEDPVGAPLMYREVNLPFFDAVRDTTKIVWRYGPIDCERPPVVLENLPVCGNCHSFSSDGKRFGMDVDFGSDKGSYAIADLEDEVNLDTGHLISWSKYQREHPMVTGGLLPSMSPDGRYVAATMWDRAVFLFTEDIAFSQLFFPATGILGIYDSVTGQICPLPGADDPRLVQSNPVWTPDGGGIVFARTDAYKPEYNVEEDDYPITLPEELCEVFLTGEKEFKFNLYRIPFNGSKGGTPEAIAGASHNGMSNYFPKFSPDGKWMVFCKAENFMLLMPDSELWIMPAAGGEPRRMECNTDRMNSWHSFSPNGKWMVFSSKVFSDYTQMMLTHLEEDGTSSPPVVLEHMTRPDRAANIPEFVNASVDSLRHIIPAFLSEM